MYQSRVIKYQIQFTHLMSTGGTAGVLLVVPRLATFSLVGSSKDGFLFSTRKQDLFKRFVGNNACFPEVRTRSTPAFVLLIGKEEIIEAIKRI